MSRPDDQPNKSPICKVEHGNHGDVYGICGTAEGSTSINCGNDCHNICTAMGIKYSSPNQCNNRGGHGTCDKHELHCCKCSPSKCGELEVRNCNNTLVEDLATDPTTNYPIIDLQKPKYITVAGANKLGKSDGVDCTIYKSKDDPYDGSAVHCVPVKAVGQYKNDFDENIEGYDGNNVKAFMVFATEDIGESDNFYVSISWRHNQGTNTPVCFGQNYKLEGKASWKCNGWGDPHWTSIINSGEEGTFSTYKSDWGGNCAANSTEGTCDALPYGLIVKTEETQIVAHFEYHWDRNVADGHINQLLTTMKSVVINFANLAYVTLLATDGKGGKPGVAELIIDYADSTYGEQSDIEPTICYTEVPHSNGVTYYVALPNGDQFRLKTRSYGNYGYYVELPVINVRGDTEGGICGSDMQNYDPISSYYAESPFQLNDRVASESIWRTNPTHSGVQCEEIFGSRYKMHAVVTGRSAYEVFKDTLTYTNQVTTRRRSVEADWLVLGEEHTVERRNGKGQENQKQSPGRTKKACAAELEAVAAANDVFLQSAEMANCVWTSDDRASTMAQLYEDCTALGTENLGSNLREQAITTCDQTAQRGGSAEVAQATSLIRATAHNTLDLTCNGVGNPSPRGCECRNGSSGPSCRRSQGGKIRITGATLQEPTKGLAHAAQNANPNNKGKPACVNRTSMVSFRVQNIDLDSTLTSVMCGGRPVKGRLVSTSTLEIAPGTVTLPPNSKNVPCVAEIDGQTVSWAMHTC